MLANAGVWISFGLLVYTLTMFFQSMTLDYTNPLGPGPGFLPLWISGILFAVTLIYLWESLKGQVISIREILPQGSARYDISLMLGGLCVFALLVEYVGFGTAGSLLIYLMIMRKYKWYYAMPAALVISFTVSVIFQNLLGVPLPVNEYGW